MPLKRFTKVGGITNLSDARYCAGMGVDLLGFRVIESDSAFIPLSLYQQIRGWVSGPKIVAEFYGMNTHTDIEGIIRDTVPDYAELSYKEYSLFKNRFSVPLIVMVESDDTAASDDLLADAAFVITEQHSFLLKAQRPILVKTQALDQVKSLISAGEYGVALEGSDEIRPGFKNYDELAEILEFLED